MLRKIVAQKAIGLVDGCHFLSGVAPDFFGLVLQTVGMPSDDMLAMRCFHLAEGAGWGQPEDIAGIIETDGKRFVLAAAFVYG